MNDSPELPLPRTASAMKSWTVTFPNHAPRSYEAAGFRVEAGALVLLLAAGSVAAFAPGQWLTVQSANADGGAP